jgi:hypothetical protein
VNARDRWRSELHQLNRSSWPEFLTTHSGLPGPRADIELAISFAELADRTQIDEMIGSDDEYLAMCGTVALGARATDPATKVRLHALASDSRWRIREAVAMGLQLLGDADPDELERTVRVWAGDPDPLVQRAAAAAICEPRLLRTSRSAATAVEVCRTATSALAQRPQDSRRDPSVRTLRQGLGYCWSVAVAADPEPGLAAFRSLDDSDPDVAWIIKENLGKKRLARLL